MAVLEGAKFCPSCGQAMAQADFAAQPSAQPFAPPPPAPSYQQPPASPQYAQPQYAQPQYSQAPYPQQQMMGASGAFTDKQTVLSQAPVVLNRPDQPWYVTVEGDSIVARWKWMDATWFALHEVTKEVKEYTFTISLDNKGKYKELDYTQEKAKGISMNKGNLGFGTSMNTFKGSKSQKSFSFGIGQDNQADKVGFISFKFDTNNVKQPMRAYLESCGWKK